jgi:hypothetical protein
VEDGGSPSSKTFGIYIDRVIMPMVELLIDGPLDDKVRGIIFRSVFSPFQKADSASSAI